MRFFTTLILLIVISGCISVKYVQLNEMPQIKQEKALIYFYRENRMGGAFEGYYVYKGNKKVGALKSGTFFYLYTQPGVHTFTVKGDGEIDEVSSDFKAGKEYFFRGGIHTGITEAVPSISFANEDEGRSEAKHLRYAVIND